MFKSIYFIKSDSLTFGNNLNYNVGNINLFILGSSLDDLTIYNALSNSIETILIRIFYNYYFY